LSIIARAFIARVFDDCEKGFEDCEKGFDEVDCRAGFDKSTDNPEDVAPFTPMDGWEGDNAGAYCLSSMNPRHTGHPWPKPCSCSSMNPQDKYIHTTLILFPTIFRIHSILGDKKKPA
jgi:hypothetical protein